MLLKKIVSHLLLFFFRFTLTKRMKKEKKMLNDNLCKLIPSHKTMGTKTKAAVVMICSI